MSIRNAGFWQDIMEVTRGRGQIRLILQPAMAIFLGIRLGIADAKKGHDPFLQRLFLTTKNRAGLLKEAASHVLIPFVLAIVIDGILQYLTLGEVKPVAALIVGVALIWVPFSVSRGLTNRIYRRTRRGHAHSSAA